MASYISTLKDYCERITAGSLNKPVLKSVKPSYLACFDIEDNECHECVFIHNEEKPLTVADISGLEETNVIPRKISEDTNEISFELGGQPLQTSFNESLLRDDNTLQLVQENEENTHTPVSGSILRMILIYAVQQKQTIPVSILCDPSDNEENVIIGCSVKDDWYTRSWVTLQGPEGQNLTADDLLEKHFCYLAPTSKRKVDVDVMCVFQVQKASEDIRMLDEDDACGKIMMKISWKKASIKIPITGVSMVMELQAVAGRNSHVHILWTQMCLLRSYVEQLRKWQSEETYPLPEQRASVLLPHDSALNQMGNAPLSEKIINALTCPEQWYIKKETTTLMEILGDINKGETPGMDITDRLWLVLTECSNYKELASNVALIFQQVKKSMVKSYLSNENKTKLAEAMRTVLIDNAAHPHLMLEPLQLLVEIGVQKLKKDYVAVFSQCLLAREEMLRVPKSDSFTTMDSCTWFETVDTYLTWMARVHAVLDLVCVAQSGLHVKTPTIVTITQQALNNYLGSTSPIKSFADLKANTSLQLSTPIAKHAYSIPAEPKYDQWLMNLYSEEECFRIKTQFLRTNEPRFPSSVLQSKNFDLSTSFLNKTEVGKSACFCAQKTTVSNKIKIVF